MKIIFCDPNCWLKEYETVEEKKSCETCLKMYLHEGCIATGRVFESGHEANLLLLDSNSGERLRNKTARSNIMSVSLQETFKERNHSHLYELRLMGKSLHGNLQ